MKIKPPLSLERPLLAELSLIRSKVALGFAALLVGVSRPACGEPVLLVPPPEQKPSPKAADETGARICAAEARDSAFMKYEVATSPFMYYLMPLIGATAGGLAGVWASEAMKGPKTKNPAFKEFLEVSAKDVALEHKRALATRAGNDAASNVAKAMPNSPHRSTARSHANETFEQYSKRMRSAGATLPDGELRKAFDQMAKSHAEIAKVQAEIKVFDGSPEHAKFKNRLNRLTGSQLARQLFAATVRADTAEMSRLSESMRALAQRVAPPQLVAGSKTGRNVGMGVAGGVIGGLAGAGANIGLTKTMCADGLSLSQATTLSNYVDVSVRKGCEIHRAGAYQIMTMSEQELIDLCNKVPQLPQIIAKSYEKEMAEKGNLPKPDSIEPDCAAGTMKATMSGRTYDYKLSKTGPDKVAVDVKVSGKISRPLEFFGHFDTKLRKFAVSQTPELAPNSLAIATDDRLNAIYLGRIDEKIPQEEPQMVAGEGFNLARSLVPAFHDFCDGPTRNSGASSLIKEPAQQ